MTQIKRHASPGSVGKGRKEDVMTTKLYDEMVIWRGPGWYAPRQEGQYESTHIRWYQLPDVDEDDYDGASKEARHRNLGTPMWISAPEEIDSDIYVA